MPRNPKTDVNTDPDSGASENTSKSEKSEMNLRKRKTDGDGKSSVSPPKQPRISKSVNPKTNLSESNEKTDKVTRKSTALNNKSNTMKIKIKLNGDNRDLDKKVPSDHLKVKYKTKTKKKPRKSTSAKSRSGKTEGADNADKTEQADRPADADQADGTNEVPVVTTVIVASGQESAEIKTENKQAQRKTGQTTVKTRVRKQKLIKDSEEGICKSKKNTTKISKKLTGETAIEKTKSNSQKGKKNPVKSEAGVEDESVQADGQSSNGNHGNKGGTEEEGLMEANQEITRVVKVEGVSGSSGDNKPGTAKFVGAHVSISGGLENAVFDALAIGAKSFAMFLKSQRQWNAKPLTDDQATKFKEACQKHGFPPHLILPHGSYLLNCGSPNPETRQKSQDGLVDELQRCEKLGLVLFNFHPGSTCGEMTVDECLDKIAECINVAHSKTKYCIAVIENMSCQGNTIGGKFSELRGIIDRVKDKSRIGVCLDTCHAFAAGYDLSSEKGFHKMVAEFEEVIGFQYLKGMHVNDSMGELGCHKDRHENIGKGHITKVGFRHLMEDPHFDNIPLILETPCREDDTYKKEIKLLYSFCK